MCRHFQGRMRNKENFPHQKAIQRHFAINKTAVIQREIAHSLHNPVTQQQAVLSVTV